MKIVFIFLLFLIYNSQTISDSNNYSIGKKLEKIIAENEELKKNYEKLKNNQWEIYNLKKNYEELKKDYEELKNNYKTIEELKKNNDELNQKVENLQTFIKSRQPIYRLWNDVRNDHIYTLEAEKNNLINKKSNYKYEGIAFYAFKN